MVNNNEASLIILVRFIPLAWSQHDVMETHAVHSITADKEKMNARHSNTWAP